MVCWLTCGQASVTTTLYTRLRHVSPDSPGHSPCRQPAVLIGRRHMTTKKSEETADTLADDGMNRRQFLTTATAAAGGAMTLGFWLPSRAEAAAAPAAVTAETAMRPEPWYRDPQVPEINAWFTLGPDDTVTFRC